MCEQKGDNKKEIKKFEFEGGNINIREVMCYSFHISKINGRTVALQFGQSHSYVKWSEVVDSRDRFLYKYRWREGLFLSQTIEVVHMKKTSILICIFHSFRYKNNTPSISLSECTNCIFSKT